MSVSSATGIKEMDPPTANAFKYTFILSQVVGITIIVLAITWAYSYLGGFGLKEPLVEFNYHVLCMVTGMVYLTGNSMITYRGFRSFDKPLAKKIHAGLHFAALFFSSIGLFAVVDFHNRKSIPNFYSLHSWLGIVIILVYSAQSVLSFYVFMFPGASPALRGKLLPIHVTGGYILFGLVITACLSGLTEKALFSMPLGKPNGYPETPPAGILVNTLGVTLILYYLIVMHILTHPDYQRIYPPPPPPPQLMPPMT